MLNISNIQKDFPILNKLVNGKKLVYLDNAATTQKPRQVIEALNDYYFNHNANVKRGHHQLGDEASELFAKARSSVAQFIGAATPDQIIFTKGATDSLNIVAFGWGANNLKPGDVVLTTVSEHNSSVLPWQNVCKKTGAKLDYLSVDEDGFLIAAELKQKLISGVKVLALSHSSNVLGNILDIKTIAKEAHKVGAIVVVDGSQAVPSTKVNMQSLDCDFYAFSAHKMLGTMGVGILYGKKDLLDQTLPIQFGGGMVMDVDLDSIELAQVPDRLEAGTPNVGGVIALAAAIEYINNIGIEAISLHEKALSEYAINKLSQINGCVIVGPHDISKKVGLVSFYIKGIHSHDLASILSEEGVAVRSGLHCAMNLHKQKELPPTTRASFYIYNEESDIDVLIGGIQRAIEILG